MGRSHAAERQAGRWVLWAVCIAGVLPPARAAAGLLYTDIPDEKLGLFDSYGELESSYRTIDLNRDGTADIALIFEESGWYHEGMYVWTDFADVSPLGTTAVAGGGLGGGPGKLTLNDVIDGSRPFLGARENGYSLTALNMNPGGPWGWSDFAGKFVGVRMEVEGQPHYGWVRISLGSSDVITIHDYAFETTAGAPIVAGVVPEPSSSIALVLSAVGLGLSRVRRRHA